MSDRTSVSRLPFTLTWRPGEVYVTTNSRKLQVYKVPLECSATGISKQTPILVPKNTIILPRSARHRMVRFFPNLKGGTNSLLLIDSQHCEAPAPPIGIYLSEDHLGEWVEVEKGLASQDGNCSQRRAEPLFEMFDAEDDCDLIPYDPDFYC